MARCEYKLLSGAAKVTKGGQTIDWSETEKQLNDSVADGWEIVSSNTSSGGVLVFGCGSQEPIITFVLRKSQST